MLHEYAVYLSSVKGYSPNTIRGYIADCREFVTFIKQHTNVERWSEVTRQEIDAWVIQMKEAGLSASTSNRRLAAVAGLYRYFKREGYDVENPCQYESRRKQPERVPSTIAPEQIRQAYKHATGPAKVMIGILASTGIRIAEMLNLTWQDIDFATHQIRIFGKGQKERQVIASNEVISDLDSRRFGTTPKGRIFWLNQRHARHIIYEALHPYCTARQLSPHAIRHTFATELAKSGANVTTIAKILGHSSISTTQKYIDMAQLPTNCVGISLT